MNQKQSKKSKKSLIVFYALLLVVVLGSVYALSSGTITGMVVASDNSSKITDEVGLQEQTFIQENDETTDLIHKILFLRQSTNSNSLLDIAKTYNFLDQELTQTTHSGLWRIVADCSYDVCEDKSYLNLIHSITLTSNSKNHELIAKTINTAYLWQSRNEALFSESLTTTDNIIRNDFEQKLSYWEDYLDCNCPGEFEALFILINELNN